jgi:hypothetical protein
MRRTMRSKGRYFALAVFAVVTVTICLDVFVAASRGQAHLLTPERKATIVAGTPCTSGLIADYCIAPLGCDNTVSSQACGGATTNCIGTACDNPSETNTICNDYADYFTVSACEDQDIPSGCGHYLDFPACAVSPVSGNCACAGTSSQRPCTADVASYNDCKPE